MSYARLASRNKKFKRCKKCFPYFKKRRTSKRLKIDFEKLAEDPEISEEFIKNLQIQVQREKQQKQEDQEDEEEELENEQRYVCRCR